MTGKRPEDWRDYYMPRTGEFDANGVEGRVNFPSYMKEVIALRQHPGRVVVNSLNPAITSIADMLNNRDYYDTEIFAKGSPWPVWMKEGGMFLGKQFVPFSVSGAMNMGEESPPLWKEVFPFFGIVPTPRRMTMTPAEEMAAEAMAAGMPKQPRTREQFDRSKLIKEIVADFKAGHADAPRARTAAGIEAGTLSASSVTTMIDRLKYSPLQFQVTHLNAETAMRVWRVASPAEREQLRTIVTAKVLNARSLAPERAMELLEEVGQ